MSSDLRPVAPGANPSVDLPPAPSDSHPPAEAAPAEHGHEAQQAQQDQARQAQQAQEAQMKKAAAEALQKMPEMPSLNQDFLSLIESIAKEAYEAPKAQAGGKSGEQDSGNMGGKPSAGNSQKDLQILKEFIREANYLVKSQNMDVAQMLNTIKVEQGGLFWQKLQGVLQKGIPVSQVVVFQNLEKNLQEMTKQFMGMEGFQALSQGTPKESGGLIQPGRAILEIVQAEANPQGAMDHYMGALQILMRDGLQISAQKLVSYLRRRSGHSQHQASPQFWAELLRKDLVAPHVEKVERGFSHWLYIVFASGIFAVLMGLGFDWLASLMVGASIAVVIFVFSLVFKK